jgi:hypothetical protein
MQTNRQHVQCRGFLQKRLWKRMQKTTIRENAPLFSIPLLKVASIICSRLCPKLLSDWFVVAAFMAKK